MFTKVRTFLIMGLFLLVLSGCTVSSGKPPVVSPSVSPSPAAVTPGISPATSYQLISNEVQAYIISGTDFSKQAVTFEADIYLPFDEFIDTYFDTLEDEGFYLGLKDAYLKGDGAYVDFNSKYYPGSIAQEYEKELLDCIAQTILENYKGIYEIYYLIDGSDYVSDKINLENGKFYISK